MLSDKSAYTVIVPLGMLVNSSNLVSFRVVLLLRADVEVVLAGQQLFALLSTDTG